MISMQEIIIQGSTLVLGFIASMLVISIWSNKRTSFWFLLTMAVLIDYLGKISRVLEVYGIIPDGFLYMGELSVLSLLFTVLPSVFLVAAFVLKLIKPRYSAD